MALNPRLYSALLRRFGEVRIINEGTSANYRYLLEDDGEFRLDIRDHGETYAVNCPECGDTRKRLLIPHMWGKPDEKKRLNLWLMKCFNETNCFDSSSDGISRGKRVAFTDEENRPRKAASKDAVELRDTFYRVMTTNFAYISKLSKIKVGKPSAIVSVDLPADSTPIHELSPHHEAFVYLQADRGLDAVQVSKSYGLVYCHADRNKNVSERIIAPVFFGGKLAGYQARPAFECDWKLPSSPLKWWTHPATKRRQVLYNYDQASKYKTGIIVEGPGDAWMTGPMCHALLGSSFTPLQQRAFQRAHKTGSGVLLLDPELMEAEKYQKNLARIREWAERVGFAGGFAFVTLPAGFDPGSLPPAITRRIIRDQAKAQGVKVSFKKKGMYGG